MLIKDIILLENQNNDSIILFKEGLFYRCYETSAFLFQQYIKPYKIVSKFVKVVNQYVIMMGFPEQNLTEIIKLAAKNGYMTEEVNEHQISIHDLPINTGFDDWKAKMCSSINTNLKKTNAENEIIKRIKDYPLVAKTPLDTQQFVYELQCKLNGNI